MVSLTVHTLLCLGWHSDSPKGIEGIATGDIVMLRSDNVFLIVTKSNCSVFTPLAAVSTKEQGVVVVFGLDSDMKKLVPDDSQ